MTTKLNVQILLFFAVLSMTSPATAAQPHRSIGELPMSNGFGVAHFSTLDNKLKTFFPHIYRQYDEGTPIVPNWLFDAYFGIRRGEAVWFNEAPSSAEYETGSGIVHVTQDITVEDQTIPVDQYIFAPWELDSAATVMLVAIPGPVEPFAAFSLHNFQIGGGDPATADERAQPRDWGFVENGALGSVVVRALTPADGRIAGSGTESPFEVMKRFADFPADPTDITGNDIATGFQFNVPSGIAAGETQWFGIVLAGTEADAATLETDVETWIGGLDPEALLTRERGLWADWVNEGAEPPGLSEDEAAVWKQSLVMLRMGQVREPNGPDEAHRPFGAILAALPKAHPRPGEGIWNMSWPRDASYAISGLSRAGHGDEARAGLEFMLNASAGEYRDYVGYDYTISVCRYYGKGREESDANEDGPNVEFDDFGLFLWALGEQVKSPQEDAEWWKARWPAIRDGVADTLVSLTEADTQLIAADSSIWERHWNGKQKHFAYSSIMAAKGLCVAADLADQMGEAERAATYRQTVSTLSRGIRDRLVRDNVLYGNLEELRAGAPAGDLAAVEAFNHGIFAADDPVMSGTLDHWRANFYDGDENGGGYWRNDDGDWYDNQEWVVIDLRMAVALGYAGRTQERDALIAWVVAQTRANYDIIGELYCRGGEDCPTRGDYRGSFPMIGFGPGAYLLALNEREGGDIAPTLCAEPAEPAMPGADMGDSADAGADTGTTPEPPDSSSNDGCATAGRSPLSASWLALLALLVGIRSRRSQV